MKFRYLSDPLFLATVVIYVVNRYVLEPYLEPHVPGTFFSSYVNDLICIPFCLPMMLWAMRVTRVRRHDRPPMASEIFTLLLVISVTFELIFPNVGPLVGRTFADTADILCYSAGACFASIFWQYRYAPKPATESE